MQHLKSQKVPFLNVLLMSVIESDKISYQNSDIKVLLKSMIESNKISDQFVIKKGGTYLYSDMSSSLVGWMTRWAGEELVRKLLLKKKEKKMANQKYSPPPSALAAEFLFSKKFLLTINRF